MDVIKSSELLDLLETRFSQNHHRHPNIRWNEVLEKLKSNPGAIESLQKMELSGGEPDVVEFAIQSHNWVFMDCSAESPAGRRSLCYDSQAFDARKEFKPAGNAMDMAAEMGVQLLNEEEYRFLQSVGNFDLKTSSWLLTPPEIRLKGGALFGDKRYDHTFVYHNGAQSYYAARGFRALLIV
jgi:hypothetical protein